MSPEEINKLKSGAVVGSDDPDVKGMLAEIRKHTQAFDMRMIRIELMRHPEFKEQLLSGTSTPFADYWKGGNAFCTMNQSKSIIKLPATGAMHATGRHGHKPPKLSEAYEFFTGKPLEGAHDAAVDLMACKAVYWGIHEHWAKAV